MSTHKYFFPSFSTSDPAGGENESLILSNSPLSLRHKSTKIIENNWMWVIWKKSTTFLRLISVIKFLILMSRLNRKITGNNWILKFCKFEKEYKKFSD